MRGPPLYLLGRHTWIKDIVMETSRASGDQLWEVSLVKSELALHPLFVLCPAPSSLKAKGMGVLDCSPLRLFWKG